MKAEVELSHSTPEVQEFSGFKTAKLPKLVISKFDGSFIDWSRFLGQSTEAIDKSSKPLSTKFTYANCWVQILSDVLKPCLYNRRLQSCQSNSEP